MKKNMLFSDVVEAADNLSLDEQEELTDILYRRTIESKRLKLAKEIKNANLEFKKGNCLPVKPSDLLKEILS